MAVRRDTWFRQYLSRCCMLNVTLNVWWIKWSDQEPSSDLLPNPVIRHNLPFLLCWKPLTSNSGSIREATGLFGSEGLQDPVIYWLEETDALKDLLLWQINASERQQWHQTSGTGPAAKFEASFLMLSQSVWTVLVLPFTSGCIKPNFIFCSIFFSRDWWSFSQIYV